MAFSPNIDSLRPSATLALAARARKLKAEGASIVDLSAGEPAFGTPAYASEAGIEAIRAGHTGYPPTQGIPELREAIARYLEDTTSHSDADASQVLVGAGVKQVLFNCCFCLFGSDDEVIVPAPYWPSYTTIVELAGATPVVVDTRWEDGFQLELAALDQARTDRTRGLMINSPSNPTGAVYDSERLRRIVEWCGEHGIWLLSDEIYRRLSFTELGAPSVYDVSNRSPNVVLMDGVSKAWCMPGWRIGFAVGPPELITKAKDLQSQTTSGAVGPSQYAAAEAIGNRSAREEAIETLLRRLRQNRASGMPVLEATEALEVRPPEGAIYFYARLKGRTESMEIAERLLTEAGVACIPGEPFGSPGYLRFNLAVEEEVMAAGLGRVRDFLNRMG